MVEKNKLCQWCDNDFAHLNGPESGHNMGYPSGLDHTNCEDASHVGEVKGKIVGRREMQQEILTACEKIAAEKVYRGGGPPKHVAMLDMIRALIIVG